uniref:Uncharacterized protein n=1 Tax=uncultured Nocardioidaceae bacterium TaxID=253824 RepID=A0A6J4M546_9ACTN|nr:MAG: hypothetical protein AVDCRST_MAG46-2565 [uncultured Nocardioidaceae bacterium]
MQTPEFVGITPHDVLAKPAASSMPFRWTVNPWRDRTHACFH